MNSLNTSTSAQTVRIRDLNDRLRTTLTGGRVFITPGIAGLSAEDHAAVLTAVVSFTDFTTDNDPRGEHDFGSVDVGEHKVFWKIDYYDLEMKYLSPDPGDPDLTNRVLTIMLASEY